MSHTNSRYRSEEIAPRDNLNESYPTREQAQDSPQPKTDLLGKIEIGEKVPEGIENKLNAIHMKYSSVFDGDLREGYNGNSGNFDVNFNFKAGIPPTPHQHSVPR